MNDYDKVARYAARMLDPPGYFQWLMGLAFCQELALDGLARYTNRTLPW